MKIKKEAEGGLSQSPNSPGNKAPVPISEKALERRVRRFYAGSEHHLFASCVPGLEEILRKEMVSLPGVVQAHTVEGGVEFSGPVQLVYHANLKLRSAERILLRIAIFHCKSYPELFNRVKRMPWEAILGGRPGIAFRVSASSSRLHHTGKIAETCTEAIETHFHGLKADFSPEDAGGVSREIFVRLHRDQCTISLDTSGEGLHRRGYRTHIGKAPLRENLAAALLLPLDLSRYPVILDPCSGSGTFVLEAASLVEGYLPGAQRNFAFENLPFYSEKAWKYIFNQAMMESSGSLKNRESVDRPLVMGVDIEPSAVQAARNNANHLVPGQFVTFLEGNAFDLKNIWGSRGLLVSNLPYGVRISRNESKIKEFYSNFIQMVCTEFSGWDFLFLVKNPHHFKGDSIDIARKLSFENGGLRVTALYGTIR